MRSQKSRSRGNKNRNSNNRPQGNVLNRVFDSSGPEGKVRGTPQQIIDKYQQLHRDAQLSNDRVAAENFAQHAEHYARLLGEATREQENHRKAQEAQARERQEAQEAQARERQKEREEQQQGQKAQQQRDRDEQPSAPPVQQDAQAPVRAAPPAEEMDQPDVPQAADVIDLNAGDSESGLVETVENKPKPRKPRTRKPRAKPKDEAAAEPQSKTDTPAAE